MTEFAHRFNPPYLGVEDNDYYKLITLKFKPYPLKLIKTLLRKDVPKYEPSGKMKYTIAYRLILPKQAS